MPALRKYMLSVAPADMPGTISTLGKRWWTAAVTAAITSWRSGEAGLATGGGGCTVTVAVASSMTLIRVARTLSTEMVAAAAASSGWAANRVIAAPSGPGVWAPSARSEARVISLLFGGNW